MSIRVLSMSMGGGTFYLLEHEEQKNSKVYAW